VRLFASTLIIARNRLYPSRADKIDVKAPTFRPPLDDIDLTSVGAITKDIDKAFVLDNLITEEFCDFAVSMAGVVSHQKGEVRAILESPSNDKSVFELLEASDLSWAFMVYTNSREVWEWLHQDKARKASNALLAERRRQRTESGGRGPRIPADKDATPQPKPTWSVGNRSKKKEWGVSPQGRAMYFALKKALKEVGPEAWAGVWESFWEKDVKAREAAAASSSSKKRKTPASGEEEEDEEENIEAGDLDVAGLDMSDDEEGPEVVVPI
jgi:hypothetical protein